MKIKNDSLFIHFAISYTVILFIQFTAAFLIYTYSARTMEKYILKSNQNIFEHISNTLDKNALDINNIVNQISADTKVRSFQFYDKPFDGANVWYTYDLQNQLFSYSVTNSFIDDYYIVFRNSKTVVKPHQAYRFNQFYPRFYKQGDYDSEKWYDFMFSKRFSGYYLPQQTVYNFGEQKHIVTCLYSLGQAGNPYAVLVLNINVKQFVDALSAINIGTNGSAYIENSNGEIICKITGDGADDQRLESAGNEVPLDNKIAKEMLITTYTSKTSGWRFTAVQSPNDVLDSMNTMRATILFGLLSALLTGIILSIWFAKRNANPIKKVFDKLLDGVKGAEPSHNIYEDAEKAVISLFDKNSYLQKEIVRQIPLLQMGYFSQLLNGGFYDHEAAQVHAQQVGICTSANYYAAILIENAGMDRISEDQIHEGYMELIKLEQDINVNAPKEFYTVKLNTNQIVLIGAFENQEKSDCMEKIKVLAEKISQTYHGMNIYIGNIYNDIFSVYDSYREAEQISQLAMFKTDKESILWHGDIRKSNDSYYYDVEAEGRLINIIRSGDLEQLRTVLKEIIEENFQNRELSASMQRILWFELRGTLVKLMDLIEMQMHEVYNNMKESLDNLETAGEAGQFSGVIKLFTEVCMAIGNKKRKNDEFLKDRILKYIEDNYSNADLCLDSLAEHFRVSVSFLSGIFKEQVNQSFYTILEDMRMGEAKRLLGETDIQIKDILEQVGYSSFNTFGRAFKRINGISPSEYRTMARKFIVNR